MRRVRARWWGLGLLQRHVEAPNSRRRYELGRENENGFGPQGSLRRSGLCASTVSCWICGRRELSAQQNLARSSLRRQSSLRCERSVGMARELVARPPQPGRIRSTKCRSGGEPPSVAIKRCWFTHERQKGRRGVTQGTGSERICGRNGPRLVQLAQRSAVAV